MERAHAAVLVWLYVLMAGCTLVNTQGLGGLTVGVAPLSSVEDVELKAVGNATKLPEARQNDLRKAIVQPLCNWLKGFDAEGLCFMTDTVVVLDSKVKSWTATCASLYGGLTKRIKDWQGFAPGDITMAMACEEAYPLIRKGCKSADQKSTNLFELQSTCNNLQRRMVTQIEKNGNKVPAQADRDLLINYFLYNSPPAPTTVASNAVTDCRRVERASKVYANPCKKQSGSVLQARKGQELTYMGVTFKSCGGLWAGVAVNERIGFIKATNLGYCAYDNKKCIIEGQSCKADWMGGGAACCSSICNAWTGNVVFKFGSVQVPWRTFDGVLQVNMEICPGQVPGCVNDFGIPM